MWQKFILYKPRLDSKAKNSNFNTGVKVNSTTTQLNVSKSISAIWSACLENGIQRRTIDNFSRNNENKSGSTISEKIRPSFTKGTNELLLFISFFSDSVHSFVVQCIAFCHCFMFLSCENRGIKGTRLELEFELLRIEVRILVGSGEVERVWKWSTETR